MPRDSFGLITKFVKNLKSIIFGIDKSEEMEIFFSVHENLNAYNF